MNRNIVLMFVFLLLALPLASSVNITDYSAYYPFEDTSVMGEFTGNPVGLDGIVVANDSDAYNYGRNGSIDFDGTGDKIFLPSYFSIILCLRIRGLLPAPWEEKI